MRNGVTLLTDKQIRQMESVKDSISELSVLFILVVPQT